MAATPKPIETGIVVGQVFLGKYRVDAILGHGGMGVVAQCTHLQLQERVAIKMLRPDVLSDDDAVQRFLREAQAAAKLKSEYVAKVVDVGAFETGVPYMVMEYLDGQDLGQLLDERRQLPVPWATELILQASEALSEAHALGIVHRDVKPTNLFVTWRPDGSALVKVLDFGISKSPMGADMQLTQTQSLLGTPAYMSPEQMRSARLVDLRSDVWSLGTVLYEAIEGRRPFEAESFSEMCVKVAVDPPLPMRNAPAALQPVILKCLAKTPELRYANMAELGRDLMSFSQDAHGAQIIVERMERMVRRMSGDWEGVSTSGAARLSGAAQDQLAAAALKTPPRGVPVAAPMFARVDSQPHAQAWAGGSQPAAQAWSAGGSQPNAQAWAGGSQPAAQPWQGDAPDLSAMAAAASMPAMARRVPRAVETTLMVKPRAQKRGRGGLIAILVLAAIVGLTIGIVVATRSGATASNTKPRAPKTAIPTTSPPIDMNVAPAATGSAVAPPAPPPPAPPPPPPAPVEDLSAKPVDPPPATPETLGTKPPPPHGHPHPTPPPPHPHPPIGDDKPPKPDPTPETKPVPKVDDCDVYKHPHGC